MKIVVVESKKAPYVKEIEGTLQDQQAIVGGYIRPVGLGDSIYLICNEEGVREGLEPNRMIRGLGMITGTFFVTKSNRQGDFVSLSDQEVNQFIEKFTPLVIE